MPPLDQVALAIEPLAEAELPAPVALGRDVGRGTLVLDQLADSVGVACLVSEHGGARPEMVEQRVGDLPVMRSMPNRKIGRARHGRQRLTGAATEEGR